MKTRKWLIAAIAILAIGSAATAQDRRLFGKPIGPRECECPPGYPSTLMPPDSSAPRPPSDQPPSDAFREALASAGESGTQPPASAMPPFFGDIIGGQVIMGVNTSQGFFVVGMPNPTQNAGFKIAENDSPRPMDRVYYNYNLFGNINVNLPGSNGGAPLLKVNRHVIGVEKTFLDGAISAGLRLPFLTLGGDPGYSTGYTGDLTVIVKGAIFENRSNGNILSAGLVIGTPTGGTPVFLDAQGQRTNSLPRRVDVTLQPFGGYIYSVTHNIYVHGFHSVAVPTDPADVTFMSNDVGLGYWLFRNSDGRFLQAIVPTVEIHVNTPFNHRDLNGPVFMNDQVTLTSGAYFQFSRATLGGAVGVPFTGPHTIEAVASVTMRF